VTFVFPLSEAGEGLEERHYGLNGPSLCRWRSRKKMRPSHAKLAAQGKERRGTRGWRLLKPCTSLVSNARRTRSGTAVEKTEPVAASPTNQADSATIW